MDKYTSPISYWLALLYAVFGALTLNELAIIVGIIATVSTVAINWYYKRRDFLHKKRLREQYYQRYNRHDKDE